MPIPNLTSQPKQTVSQWLASAPQAFLRSPRFSANREQQMAIAACGLWFWAQLLYLHDLSATPWPWLESVVEAAAVVIIGGFPVLWWASGQRDFNKMTQRWPGRLLLSLALYIAIGLILPQAGRFPWQRVLTNLIFADQPWLNLLIFLGGVWAMVRVPVLLQQQTTPTPVLWAWISGAALYLLLSHSGLISPAFPKAYTEGFIITPIYLLLCAWGDWQRRHPPRATPTGLGLHDIPLIAVSLFSLYWFSTPYFRFGPFVALQLFILVIIFGRGLGRSHFGYSFEPRWCDARLLAAMFLAALVTMVPLGSLLGFLPLAKFNLTPSPLAVFVYVSLFAMRVGIFEEVLFRSGLMIFVRDLWQHYGGDRQRPVVIAWGAILICSLLFGILHVGNEPNADIQLPLMAYRAVYIIMATLASLFYCLTFACTQRLWAGVLLHGLVDAIAVVFFGAALVTPF
ncbi:CPBP family intramembrane glutamic endopeptidase [Thermosynechococcus sp. TG252]|uniref:CPBP family intramembrane glutamic endopeptidase n=1 Tax=Thermosynechococcus sp. TG252 TaxID=3074097 RepID=UPI0028601E08|nr:CPBP family intramembrane glutamic endopeptidase [Thermosynechococcus sp. TG252]MDR7993552.1 CPBP family intramembrane glutamic endopeptidase [Thermosynechococcus sp. TG252]